MSKKFLLQFFNFFFFLYSSTIQTDRLLKSCQLRVG